MLEISRAEWEVMRVIWANGAVTSAEIINWLHPKQAWSASTVRTLLGRLVQKGILKTKRQGRTFYYQATVTEDQALEEQLDGLFSLICDKKQSAMLTKLLQTIPMTDSDWLACHEVLSRRRLDLQAIIPCRCALGQCACAEDQREEDDD